MWIFHISVVILWVNTKQSYILGTQQCVNVISSTDLRHNKQKKERCYILGKFFREKEMFLDILHHWAFHVLHRLENSFEIIILYEGQADGRQREKETEQ